MDKFKIKKAHIMSLVENTGFEPVAFPQILAGRSILF